MVVAKAEQVFEMTEPTCKIDRLVRLPGRFSYFSFMIVSIRKHNNNAGFETDFDSFLAKPIEKTEKTEIWLNGSNFYSMLAKF